MKKNINELIEKYGYGEEYLTEGKTETTLVKMINKTFKIKIKNFKDLINQLNKIKSNIGSEFSKIFKNLYKLMKKTIKNTDPLSLTITTIALIIAIYSSIDITELQDTTVGLSQEIDTLDQLATKVDTLETSTSFEIKHIKSGMKVMFYYIADNMDQMKGTELWKILGQWANKENIIID